jgi:hypothetical protein
MDVMADAPQAPGRRRARLWWIALAVLLVVGLLGYFGAPVVQSAVLRVQLGSETAAALTTARPAADAAHAEWLHRVVPVLGLGPDAAYSASYDVCYVDHTDGGWVALNYNQKCQLSYVDYFELPEPNHAVDEAIAEATSAASAPATSAVVFVDDYLKAAGRPADGAPDDMPFSVSATLPGASDARAATDEWMVTQDVVAYAAGDAFADRALLGEAGQRSLDPAREYLVVQHAHAYYERDIGCAVGRSVFCWSPLGED